MIDARFWSKVNKHGPRASRLGRCWLWMGARQKRGYGHLGRNGKTVLAHRFAWGDVPDGMLVLHRCDNPPCVRRSHLFLGTKSVNALDAVAKGRWPESQKTHCLAGHPYDRVDSNGGRRCRRCENAALREAYRRAA